MPSKSKKQAKLMAAVAHNPEFANKVGIPQSVGKDFNEADQARKFDIVDVSPDGKEEMVDGKEILHKDPKDPKKRWKLLKKALDHNKAFMDLEEEMEDEPDQQAVPPQPGAEQAPPQEDQSAMQQEPQEGEEQEQPVGDEADSEAVSPPPEEGEEQEDPEEGNGDAEPDPQELIDALKEEGYSDQEIAYIMHGQHAGDVDETKAAKADATRAMSDIDIQNALKQAEIEHSHNEQSLAAEREHKKRMQDLEYEQAQKKHALVDQDAAHKQRMSDIEYQQAQQANPQALEQEHKKRMLDLEYEKAKKEASSSDGTEGDAEANKQMKMLEVEKKKLELQLRKEEMKLELEFKKREHDLKLKMMEAQLKEQAKQKQEIGGIKHEQRLKEAKNPPKKPLKKSEEADDEGRDQ